MKKLLIGLLLLNTFAHASNLEGFSLYKLAYFSEIGLTSSDRFDSYNDMLSVFNKSKLIAMKKYGELTLNMKNNLSKAMNNSIDCLANSNSDEAMIMNHIMLSPIPGNAVDSFEKHIELISKKCKVHDEVLEARFVEAQFLEELNRYVIYKYLYLNLLNEKYDLLASIMKNTPEKWNLFKWTFEQFSLDDYCNEEEMEDFDDLEERKLVEETCSNLRNITILTAENIGLDSNLLQRLAFGIVNEEEEVLGYVDIPQIKSYYFKTIPFSSAFGY